MSGSTLSRFGTPTGVIVHVGAGIGRSLTDYAAEQPDHILLVEPHPESVVLLRQTLGQLQETAPDLSIEIICAAVAVDTGQSPFHMLNFADLSSLCLPVSLGALMQGVRVEQSLPVKTLSLADLLKDITFQADKRHRLILEAPGMELAILKECAAGGLFETFEDISVIAGAESYFEGGSDASKVLNFLTDSGYDLITSVEAADPDWPCLSLRRNLLAVKLAKMTEELAALETRHEAEQKILQGQLTQTAKDRDAARQQAQKVELILKDRHAKAEEQLLKTHDLEQKNLQTQLDQARAAQQTVSDQALVTEQGLNGKLSDTAASLAAAEASLGVLRVKLNAAEALRAEAEAKTSRAESDQIAAERGAKQELAMALRLQVLQQQDFADLQQRYMAAQIEAREQEDLLIKLTQKLGSAAGYLHALSDDSIAPEQITQAPTQNRAPKKPAAKSTTKTRKAAAKTDTKVATKSRAKTPVRKKSSKP